MGAPFYCQSCECGNGLDYADAAEEINEARVCPYCGADASHALIGKDRFIIKLAERIEALEEANEL